MTTMRSSLTERKMLLGHNEVLTSAHRTERTAHSLRRQGREQEKMVVTHITNKTDKAPESRNGLHIKQCNRKIGKILTSVFHKKNLNGQYEKVFDPIDNQIMKTKLQRGITTQPLE